MIIFLKACTGTDYSPVRCALCRRCFGLRTNTHVFVLFSSRVLSTGGGEIAPWSVPLALRGEGGGWSGDKEAQKYALLALLDFARPSPDLPK